MSIKSAISGKNKFLDETAEKFRRDFEKLEPKIKAEMLALVKAGDISYESLEAAFDKFYLPLARSYQKEYRKVIRHVNRINVELNIKPDLPNSRLAMIQLFEENGIEKLLRAPKSAMNNMVDAAMKYHNEGKSFGNIVKDQADRKLLNMRAAILDENITKALEMSRQNVYAEANTGITNYDRAIRNQQYQELEIELFRYVGPLDDSTRDVCVEVLTSPQNDVGWTREDIIASPVDFVTGGGYNCRHDFYPFVDIQ